ncbi:Protein of unknown function DUF1356, TMEM106 family-containing protein [Aphelenchoides fujianensis]|nr:Protein of unknown function DUF1356, TMEM106 family-containing protein [Aphelenchoides fujianensis]
MPAALRIWFLVGRAGDKAGGRDVRGRFDPEYCQSKIAVLTPLYVTFQFDIAVTLQYYYGHQEVINLRTNQQVCCVPSGNCTLDRLVIASIPRFPPSNLLLTPVHAFSSRFLPRVYIRVHYVYVQTDGLLLLFCCPQSRVLRTSARRPRDSRAGGRNKHQPEVRFRPN